MYKKSSTGIKACLFGLVFCLLFLSPLSLSAQSSSASGSVVKTFTASEWAAVQADYQALSKTLADLQATNKQQADKIVDLESQLTQAKQQQTELQATIDSQAGKLTALNLNLISSARTLESSKTVSTIGWTVAGIGILGDIVQIVLHGLKLW